MDIMRSTFGKNPTLRCRGTIGNSQVNLNALAVAMKWASVFNIAYYLDITSSSAADDGAPAGTGAQIIRILGLDASYNRIYEDVTLNGTTIVTTTKKFLRVISAYVKAAGTGLVNAGDIYIIKTGTGGTYTAPGVPDTLTSAAIKMPVGGNVGFSGLITVPRGCSMMIKEFIVTARAQNATVIFTENKPNSSDFKGPYEMLKIEVSDQSGGIAPSGAWILDEKTDLYIQSIAAAAGGIVNCSISLEQIAGPSYVEV